MLPLFSISKHGRKLITQSSVCAADIPATRVQLEVSRPGTPRIHSFKAAVAPPDVVLSYMYRGEYCRDQIPPHNFQNRRTHLQYNLLGHKWILIITVDPISGTPFSEATINSGNARRITPCRAPRQREAPPWTRFQ